ncbi:hypothetical protein NA57DRAFT_71233 [Rhizodiscina lignyota]|uniref:Uncharacterized protein n=1 Tax=Rhizodiscina lignyota TaxID=1504668 RepID=A0A9P4IRY7_9PEZI|nr:hypothetical protein NA57DRAFT_71233 [Rhizodiscina lignyota]
MISILKRALAVSLTLVLAAAASPLVARQAKSKPGACTADNRPVLPKNVQQLTVFGERASWSPDGKKIGFMDKSYGDAFEIDLKTKEISLLTHFPNPGYLRVQYLPNGDYILLGARSYVDADVTRDTRQEIWVLKKGAATAQPLPLNQLIWEGIAISRLRNRIAWAQNYENNPDDLIEGETAIYVADIVYNKNGTVGVANKRQVLRDISPHCLLEPQDFHNDDNELTYTCYTPVRALQGNLANVRSIDLRTGKVTIYRDVQGQYNEVEGIFPNGKYTCVESGKDQIVSHGDDTIDIWKLRLEPHSSDFTRLTNFGDCVGNKAADPVISPDSRTMAFQAGRSGDLAGVGYGIFLLDLEKS